MTTPTTLTVLTESGSGRSGWSGWTGWSAWFVPVQRLGEHTCQSRQKGRNGRRGFCRFWRELYPPQPLSWDQHMNQPNKHHFVPAFYLSRWAGGQPKCELVEWSKPYKALGPTRRHPNATGFQPGLYSFESSDPNLKQWFESVFLRDVDNAASLVIDRIIGGQAARSGCSQGEITLGAVLNDAFTFDIPMSSRSCGRII